MAKRKITVTVDAATLEQAQTLGVQNLSAVVAAAVPSARTVSRPAR